MKKLKFKVGDKIRYKGQTDAKYYDFKHDGIIAKRGDIFTISAVEKYNLDSSMYSVEGAYIQHPNWYDMEDNFELAEIDWQKELE